MKTLIVVTTGALCASIGEALLAKGMKELGDVSRLEITQVWRMLAMFGNPKVVAGTVFMAMFFFTYSASLSWADLSLVLPSTALSFLFATAIAQLYLGEHVSTWRWTGIVIIMLGIGLVWMNDLEPTAREKDRIERSPAVAASR